MSAVYQPKVSIITPSYNQAQYIEETIHSVLQQNYPAIEHIVIDGDSTDGTIDILKRSPQLIWVSEPDRGQADALNKGLTRATGEIVGWINSDDLYESGAILSVVECFREPDIQWAVGNLKYIFGAAREYRTNKSPEITYLRLLANPDIVRQQSTFFRKDFLVRSGGWNPDYFMAMDYDLWVRLASMAVPKMVDNTWAIFRLHEQQKTSHANILRQTREIVNVLKRERAPKRYIIRITARNRWYWLKSLVKHALINVGLISHRFRSRPIRFGP